MRIYIAAMYTSNFGLNSTGFHRLTPVEQERRRSISNVLESYHYIHKQSYVDSIRADGVKVFLDSGAFSAFTKGVEINIREYCDYIKRNEDIIEVASVLDGIGNAQQTYEHQCFMESLGVKPLPCFHYGEDERYLEYYLANYDYITLGGMVPISTPQLHIWLDRLWDKYLTDGSGRPRIKIHGFGLTAIPLMEKYPWYSVDSSSWVQMASNGAIYLPEYGIIPISQSSPQAKNEGQHFLTRPIIEQEAIRRKLDEYGFECDRMVYDYRSRWTFNAWIYTELNRRYDREKVNTFFAKQIGLFDD